MTICKVSICPMTDCIHNEHHKCTLPKIELDENATCKQMERPRKEEWFASNIRGIPTKRNDIDDVVEEFS